MGKFTEHFRLYIPDIGERGWGEKVNENFELIDKLFHIFGENILRLVIRSLMNSAMAQAKSKDFYAVLADVITPQYPNGYNNTLNYVYAPDKWQAVITNPNDYDLQDFQVQIEIDDPDFFQVCTDPTFIEVYDATETNLLPMFVETFDPTNNKCVIWIKVPLIKANESTRVIIKVNTNRTTSLSDPTQVFDFYDDFNELSSDWVNVTGTWSAVNGYAVVTNDYGTAPGNVLINTKANFDWTKYLAEALVIYLANGQDCGVIIASQGTSASSPFDVSSVTYSSTAGGKMIVGQWLGSSWDTVLVAFGMGAGDKVIVRGYVRNGNAVVEAYDLTKGISGSASHAVGQSQGYLGLHHGAGITTSSKIDWVRVRKLADQEPTVQVSKYLEYVETVDLESDVGISKVLITEYGDATIEYSIDEGNTWNPIDPDVETEIPNTTKIRFRFSKFTYFEGYAVIVW